MTRVRRVDPDEPGLEASLAAVLVACVETGASVGFMLPLEQVAAEHFWSRSLAAVARGERIVIVAEDASGVVQGTVSVILDAPENQPHRGEIAKLLVHPAARRQGFADALMAAAETAALAAGKTLLVLDTANDGAAALYHRRGWVRVGEIPGYALLPAGGPVATTLYYLQMVHP